MGDEVAVERMKHHGRADPVEDPCFDHLNFPPAALLCGRPEKHDLSTDGGHDSSRGEERSYGSRGDEIVPASVTDTRQRIVLGQDGYPRTTARAGSSTQSRRHVRDSPLDLVPP